MLHWLAGQRAPDGPNDPDTTGYIEPPETPAPVFAVRAFKHAIFGTPQTVQPKPRRNSNTENSRPRNGEPRPSRPGMTRPKSASDAQALARQDGYMEPLSSPTKSILVTAGPGTPGRQKKNVTFGDDVVENEEKRPMNSGLPDDCPGKFPSPGHQLGEDLEVDEDKADKNRGKNKLTEALEQARDESRKRKSKKGKRGLSEEEDDDDVPAEFREPKSEVGKYWKREYDIYRTNTQREVKKLLTKQKAAKSFALSKDIQCTELADQLRQEQRKVEELTTKMAELSDQMSEMDEKLKDSQAAETRQLEEIAMLKRQLGRRDSARPTSSDGGTGSVIDKIEAPKSGPSAREAEQKRPELFRRTTREMPKPEPDPVQRPSEPYKPSAEPEKPRLDIQTLRARLKSRQEPQTAKPAEDIWAQSFASSSLALTQPVNNASSPPKAGRAVTSGTGATPLQTLDINTLAPGKDFRRNSSMGSMEVECKSIPDLDQAESGKSAQPEETARQDASLQSPSLPLPSASDLHSAASTAVKQEPVPRRALDEKSDLSLPVTTSSPFQTYAKPLPSRPGLVPSGPRIAPSTRPAPTMNTKENVSPNSKPQAPLHLEAKEKPSVIWGSINAPHVSNQSTASKRNTSMTAKDGREVSSDRVEAAKARINARRVAS